MLTRSAPRASAELAAFACVNAPIGPIARVDCATLPAMLRKVALAGLLLALAAAMWTWASSRGDGVRVRTLSYGPHPSQRADIYEDDAPEQAGAPAAARPVVLLIHGGGWRAGGRGELADMARWLAREGMLAVAIDYRLAPQSRWPAQAQDVEEAVWWLRENAAPLGIDPQRVAAIGSSAGAHLAAWLGTGDRPSPRGTPSRVKAVVSLAGPWDLGAGNLHDDAKAMVANLLGRQAARAASPLWRIDARAAPALLIHGSRDELIPADQSTRACEALRAAQVPCEMLLLEGEGHLLSSQAAAVSARREHIRAFLARQL
jgi:acetyl esterase/lipase